MGVWELRCDNCGAGGADVHTLLCDCCLCNLPANIRWRIQLDARMAAMLRRDLLEKPVGAIRWTEQQYVEHLRKMRTPQKPEERKPRRGSKPPPARDPRALVFELLLTPTGNEWLRTHYRKKRRVLNSIAAQLEAQIPNASGIPFASAKVEIIRRTSKEPDPDGLYGSAKPILDAMQVKSKRHPYGAHIIMDDSSDCIELKTSWEKASPKHGSVLVVVTPRP